MRDRTARGAPEAERLRLARGAAGVAALIAMTTTPRAVVADAPAAVSPVASTAVAPAPEDDGTKTARAEFVAGAEHVQKAQWADALAAFERSAALRPHALTTYNIGACERALGRYTRARRSLTAALERNEGAGGKELPAFFVDEARGFLGGIEKALVRATVTVSPVDALVAVDGRPLTASGKSGELPVVIAGLEPVGAARPAPAARFQLVMDPGMRIITVSRKGWVDMVVDRSFPPATTPELKLEMDRQPAIIKIAADHPGAVVTVNALDVGVAPVTLERPPGTYTVQVRKVGHVTYEARVDARAGTETNLRAPLPEERPSIFSRWWFWGAAGVVGAGVATTTWLLTRPTPDAPPPDGGGLNWVVGAP